MLLPSQHKFLYGASIRSPPLLICNWRATQQESRAVYYGLRKIAPSSTMPSVPGQLASWRSDEVQMQEVTEEEARLIDTLGSYVYTVFAEDGTKYRAIIGDLTSEGKVDESKEYRAYRDWFA